MYIGDSSKFWVDLELKPGNDSGCETERQKDFDACDHKLQWRHSGRDFVMPEFMRRAVQIRAVSNYLVLHYIAAFERISGGLPQFTTASVLCQSELGKGIDLYIMSKMSMLACMAHIY